MLRATEADEGSPDPAPDDPCRDVGARGTARGAFSRGRFTEIEDPDLAPVTGLAEDDSAHPLGRHAREALPCQRALRKDQDIVRDVDHRLAPRLEIPEGAGVDVGANDKRVVAPTDTHRREVRLSRGVESGDDGLDDHAVS